MKDTNTEKAKNIAAEIMSDYPQKEWCPITETVDSLRRLVYGACLMMAESKDLAFKRFLVEHISSGVEVETNEDGEPYADSFIAAGEARLKAAEEVFSKYKKFEETML